MIGEFPLLLPANTNYNGFPCVSRGILRIAAVFLKICARALVILGR